MTTKSILCTLVMAGLGTAGEPAAAAVHNLRAASTSITMADGSQVPMWGFGLTSDSAVSIPGPALVVPPGDDTLIINLTNELSVPISIVIPGILAPLTPVWNDGTSGPRTNLMQRAVSFTHVAQPGATVTYQWTSIQPGTYLYHSGTHPAVQVPMGLYGAVRHDAAPGQVYGVAYDRDQVLVYSEVDPTLNGAVTGGTYGTPGYPSTIAYRPRYSLINGQETHNPLELQQGVNERLLLRVVNAGLRSIVPTLASGSLTLLAEDGHAAPFARASYSMLLPAGKTRDALLVLTEPGSTVLFDRRGASRLARFNALPNDPPVAADDLAVTLRNTAKVIHVVANDSDSDGTITSVTVTSQPSSGGTATSLGNGTVRYRPKHNFKGVDKFTYVVHDNQGAVSAPAKVRVFVVKL